MPCCGQKRTALRTRRAAAPGPNVVQPPPSPPPAQRQSPPRPTTSARGEVRIEYLDGPRIQLRGSETGRVYQFSHHERIRAVDSRDAAGLLGTSFFRLA